MSTYDVGEIPDRSGFDPLQPRVGLRPGSGVRPSSAGATWEFTGDITADLGSIASAEEWLSGDLPPRVGLRPRSGLRPSGRSSASWVKIEDVQALASAEAVGVPTAEILFVDRDPLVVYLAVR